MYVVPHKLRRLLKFNLILTLVSKASKMDRNLILSLDTNPTYRIINKCAFWDQGHYCIDNFVLWAMTAIKSQSTWKWHLTYLVYFTVNHVIQGSICKTFIWFNQVSNSWMIATLNSEILFNLWSTWILTQSQNTTYLCNITPLVEWPTYINLPSNTSRHARILPFTWLPDYTVYVMVMVT